MKKLLLVAVLALGLSACTTMSTADKIDLGCQLAVLTAQTAGNVADVAIQHGADPVRAAKLAEQAAAGENVVAAICTVASVVTPGL